MQEFINRIPKSYVGEDCAQVMLGYYDSLAIFDRNGILFNRTPGNDYVNRYLTDERRHSFPYGEIPNHIRRKQLFDRINVTNQLLNFEESYIAVHDGQVVERFVMPDKDGALMSTKVFSEKLDADHYDGIQTKFVTREELDLLFRPINEPQQVFLMTTYGYLYLNSSTFGYQDEPDLAKNFKEHCLKEFKRAKDGTSLTSYLSRDTLQFIERQIDNITVDSLVYFPLNPVIYLIKIDNNNISIDMMYTTLIRKNYYQVQTKSIPITKYTLEQLKFLAPKIIELKEPKIPLRLNPSVTREDIRQAKKLVRTRQETNTK